MLVVRGMVPVGLDFGHGPALDLDTVESCTVSTAHTAAAAASAVAAVDRTSTVLAVVDIAPAPAAGRAAGLAGNCRPDPFPYFRSTDLHYYNRYAAVVGTVAAAAADTTAVGTVAAAARTGVGTVAVAGGCTAGSSCWSQSTLYYHSERSAAVGLQRSCAPHC